jgi:hypothetical protein
MVGAWDSHCLNCGKWLCTSSVGLAGRVRCQNVLL